MDRGKIPVRPIEAVSEAYSSFRKDSVQRYEDGMKWPPPEDWQVTIDPPTSGRSRFVTFNESGIEFYFWPFNIPIHHNDVILLGMFGGDKNPHMWGDYDADSGYIELYSGTADQDLDFEDEESVENYLYDFQEMKSILPNLINIYDSISGIEFVYNNGEWIQNNTVESSWWKDAIGEPEGIDPREYYNQVDEAYRRNMELDDDPFVEENYENEPSEEEQYESRILKNLEKEERSNLYRIIMDAGGLQNRDALREEYKGIPNTYKRRDGLPGDELAEYLSFYHPEYGIENENDLIRELSNMSLSWWKRADISDLEGDSAEEREFVDQVYEEPDPYYDVESEEEAYEWGLENSEDREPLHPGRESFPNEQMYFAYIEGFKDGTQNKLKEEDPLYSPEPGEDPEWDKYYEDLSTSLFGDDLDSLSDFLESQGEEGISEQDKNNYYDINSIMEEHVDFDQRQKEIDELNDLFKRSGFKIANLNNYGWWKQADPRFEERQQDPNYDLKMNPGDDVRDWVPQDFRVGDEVIHLPTGQEGHIEETLDVDLYNVMIDSGDLVKATPADLKLNDNDNDGDTTFNPSDIKRFEGDDPEAQNFEDPTFSLSGYIDDDIDQLRPGDKVRILYTTDESKEDFVNAMGTVVSDDGASYTIEIDGDTLSGAERDSIELMPTDYNPHYGGDKMAWWKSASDPEREERAEIGKEYDKTINMEYLQTYWPQEELVANVLDAYEKSSDTQKYAGIEWYNDIHEKAKEFSERYGYTFEQMCAVFAVISPQNSWDTNYVQAIAFVEAHAAGVLEWTDVRIWTPYSYVGKPCGLPDNNEKAWEILDTGDTSYIEYAESPKVFSFFQNFVHGPDSQDNRATIDVWATRVLFADPLIKPMINSNDGSYPYLEQGYITAAEQVGLTPKQIQAVTWVYFKEGYGKSVGDLGYMKRFDEYIATPYDERGAPPVEDLPTRPGKKKVDPKDYSRSEDSDFAYEANKNMWRSKKKRKSEENAYNELLKQERKRQREEKRKNKVRSSWWTGASINSVNEAMHSIVEAMGYLEGKNDIVVSHLREALSNLEHDSTLEASYIDPSAWPEVGDTVILNENQGRDFMKGDKGIVRESNSDRLDVDWQNGLGFHPVHPSEVSVLFEDKSITSWWKGALRIDEDGNFIIDEVEEADWARGLENEMEEATHEPSPYEMAWNSENPIEHQMEAETDMFSTLYDEGVEDARMGKESRSPREFDDEEEFNMYMSGYEAYRDFPKHSWWKKSNDDRYIPENYEDDPEWFDYTVDGESGFDVGDKVTVNIYGKVSPGQVENIQVTNNEELYLIRFDEEHAEWVPLEYLRKPEDPLEKLYRESWWRKSYNNKYLSSSVKWWKGAASLGDTAEWLIEQVGAGVLDYEEAKKEINDMILTLDSEKDSFELRSKLLLLEKVKDNPMPQQGVVPDMSYTHSPEQQQEDAPFARNQWWDA